MKRVALVTEDLMLGSQVRAACTAGSLSLQLVSPGDGEQLLNVDVVLWDLEVGVPAADTISASAARWIAFGPHVDEATLRRASDAGCQAVMPRGKFLANVLHIVKE